MFIDNRNQMMTSSFRSGMFKRAHGHATYITPLKELKSIR
jgi:hypothetical protein